MACECILFFKLLANLPISHNCIALQKFFIDNLHQPAMTLALFLKIRSTSFLAIFGLLSLRQSP